MKKPSIRDKNTITGAPRYAVSSTMAAVAGTDLQDEFFKNLAENLMLEEILRGECDPVEFLKAEIINSHNQLMRAQHLEQAKYYAELSGDTK